MSEESEVPEESEFEKVFEEIAEAKITEEAEPDPELTLDPDKKPDEPEPDPDPDPDTVVDIYEGMSQEAKDELGKLKTDNEALNHRIDSDSGRVSAFQRKVNSLEKDIQAIRKEAPAGEQPSDTDIAAAMTGSDDNWEQFKTDYPEIADTIDKRLEQAGTATQESIEQTLAPVKESQDRIAENEIETAKQSAVDTVSEAFPSWTEAVKTTEFNQWLDNQPPGIAALSGSDDTKDASALIGMYDDFLVANDKPSIRKETPGPGPGAEKEDETKSTLAVRRAQQLEDGTTVKSKPARIDPDAGNLSDFEQSFNAFAKRRESQRKTA